MSEAARQFRRVNGYLHLPTLRDALEREVEVAGVVTPSCEDEHVAA
jgi:putative transposase